MYVCYVNGEQMETFEDELDAISWCNGLPDDADVEYEFVPVID